MQCRTHSRSLRLKDQQLKRAAILDRIRNDRERENHEGEEMSAKIDLDSLGRDVQYLMDRLAIADVIAKHARGHDRHDVELLTNAYHKDGVDEHGHAINPGPKYAQWANAIHAAGSALHTHNITTHLCEIDGDSAHCETYVLVALLNNDEKSARVISGRYIDRLEKRNGEWKIALRRSTVDVLISGDASILKAPIFSQQGYTKGLRDKRDVSYQRPLNLEETPSGGEQQFEPVHFAELLSVELGTLRKRGARTP